MPDSETQQRLVRALRKFSSFEEQEAETLRYWSTRTIAEKLETAADLARQAYSIRPAVGPAAATLRDLPPVLNEKGEPVPQSRIIRKFRSFEEQDAWNDAHARIR